MLSVIFKDKLKNKKAVEKKPVFHPYLSDLFKSRGNIHPIVKFKEQERPKKSFVEHCYVLDDISPSVDILPSDNWETRMAISSLPALMALSVQPSTADQYLRV